MNSPHTIDNWLRTILFLPPQASTVAKDIDRLHFFVIITTMLGAAFVGCLGIWFAARYRRRGAVAGREEVHSASNALEWGIAGTLFSLFMIWWLIGFSQYMRVRISPPNTYDIYVTGQQWMWKFAHRDGHRSIFSVVVPAGRPVRLLMTSRDVIHSFYVPDFRIKQDVLPNRYTTLWFEVKEPGRHDIFCAEFCGTNHSSMRGEVIALSPQDFARWAAREETVATPGPYSQEPSITGELGPSEPTSLVHLGELAAAQQGCLRCHTLDGTPHIGPSFASLYLSTVKFVDGKTAIADESYLTESMMDPNAHIVDGFKAVMPSYLGRMRPGETAAIVELIRSLRNIPRTPQTQGLPPPGATRVPPLPAPVEVRP
jgi:cytochrome c oxidase subunit 2